MTKEEKEKAEAEKIAKAAEEKAKMEADLATKAKAAEAESERQAALAKQAEADRAAAEAEAKSKANLPDGVELPTPVNDAFQQPANDDYKGLYRQQSTGELFKLAITKPDEYQNTHWLKNKVHTWSGTLDEFKAQFDYAGKVTE